ncbi:MAG: hypothetical protein M1503_02870 [Thaumarchaeota archaeon]|nr:hypothetical protein [Nitrososphaerota archaeon]MCL5317194.1 hypothetical protein [Nitrososphaerota archaeon]
MAITDLTGVYAVLMIGPTIPAPVPESLANAVESIEVKNTDEGRDGFQIVFSVGRGGAQNPTENPLDYSFVDNPLLNSFNRVIIMVAFGLLPTVLIDGVITHKQFNPSAEPGQSKLTITGEDVSVMMDRKEKSTTHPNQPDMAIVSKIIASYGQYGLVPAVMPPASMDTPMMVNRIPAQEATDLQYIKSLAEAYDYVFYVEPTQAPGVNKAYWGPRGYTGVPQKALTVNMGAETNITGINFQYSSLDSTIVTGSVQDPTFNAKIPVIIAGSLRPPLSSSPDLLTNFANAKIKQYRAEGGVNVLQAYNEAQSETDGSTDAVTVTGELDGVLYGDILRARRLVGLRGVGYLHDGYYYVKNVTHRIKKGEYKQAFTLTREGLGSTTPVVTP